jgi:hypothetical protein
MDAKGFMATLLCTEAIGLNDFLHRVGVPDGRVLRMREADPQLHVVMFCPSLAGRDRMLAAAGTTDYATLLGTKKGLRAVTPWLIRQNVAREMAAKDRREIAGTDRGKTDNGIGNCHRHGGFTWVFLQHYVCT